MSIETKKNNTFKVKKELLYVKKGEIVTLISDEIKEDNYACFLKANGWSATYIDINDVEEFESDKDK